MQIPFFDVNGDYHSGLTGTGGLTPRSFRCPSGAKYMIANVLIAGEDTYQLEKGKNATPFSSPQKWYLKESYLPDLSDSGVAVKDEVLLNLPPVLYVIPGRTIELYHDQICWTGNIRNYHFKWTSKIGKAYKRKWSMTATEAMIGEHEVICTVYDNNMQEIISKTFTCVIGKLNYIGQKKILTLGDSLSNTTSTDKPWYKKIREMTDKIIFVGTRGLKEGEMHEGRSGWTAGHYLKDSVYSFENEGVNPFWNPSKNSFDYQYYKETTGISPDAIQLLLGTNGMALDPTNNANNIKTIVDKIRESDATIPIFIIHTIYRSNQDGIANQTSNDGYSASSGVWKLEEDRKVFNLIVRLQELLKGYKYLSFVPLAHCHDSEYNFGNEPMKVNPSSEIMVNMPIESIHPTISGYMQFADIFYCSYLFLNK